MKKALVRLLIASSFYIVYKLFSTSNPHTVTQMPLMSLDVSYLDPNQTVFSLEAKQNNFYFTGNDFKYCSILNNSTFDGSAYIYSLGGSIALVNPDASWFYNLIDYKAAQIEKAIISQHYFSSRQDAKRFACYSTAIGNSHFVNISKVSMLVSIDPITYFKASLPAMNLKAVSKRKKFKLAFLIMVHELEGFKNLARLLDILDDGDAIILIHVDGKSTCTKLYSKIEEWITNKKVTSDTNVYLAKYRHHNVWGHSSLVLTQLSGFWELQELAEWDFVINLSNYDWPLKRNKQVYDSLELGKNYIEWWTENGIVGYLIIDHMTERVYRPHLKKMDDSSIFHLEDLGIINSIYPRWKYIKHHQWMILTPQFVEFLRTDSQALNFLAFIEHSYIPDEMYFGTVLINSPQLSHTLINQNKRYIRFSKWAAHPSWLGWPDHTLFIYGEEVPSFFYIRKFNVFGKVYQEEKLLDWIEKYHYNNDTGNCTIEDISVNKHCLRMLASKITDDNHLIIAPVNRPYLVAAANFGCSLKSLNRQNIIFWSLDLSIHQALLSVGRLSIFLPGLPNIDDHFKAGDPSYAVIMRYRTVLMRYVLEAGFDLTFLDSDSIIIADFFSLLPKDMDLFISGTLGNSENELEISSSFIHLRNNNRSLKFVGKIEESVRLYPKASFEWILSGLTQSENLQEPIGYKILYPDFSRNTRLFHLAKDKVNLNIQILDPKRFIDSKSEIFRQKNLSFQDVFLIHYGNSLLIKNILKSSGYWYISDSGKCFIKNIN